MTDTDPYALLTRHEVAQHLRCTVAYITELTQTRQLYSLKVGKKVLIPRAALEAYIRGDQQPDVDGWPGTAPLFDRPTRRSNGTSTETKQVTTKVPTSDSQHGAGVD